PAELRSRGSAAGRSDCWELPRPTVTVTGRVPAAWRAPALARRRASDGGGVSGESRQEAGTRQMIFTVARIIAELSHGMTLLPGDIILTGTPEGVGFAQNPPAYLHPGDVVTVEISGIGRIRNRIESAR